MNKKQSHKFINTKQLYENSKTPVIFMDKNLSVIWSNTKASESLPTLHQTNGFLLYISAEQKQNILEDIKNGKTVIDRPANFPIAYISFVLTPIDDSDDTPFITCQFVEDNPNIKRQKNPTSSLSYQIREPLFYIFSSAKYIKDLLKKNSLDEGNAFIDSITTNSYRILRTTNMLGHYSRYVEGKSNLSPVVVDLSNYLYNLCKGVFILTEKNESTFSFQIPEIPIYSKISEDKLSTAILNIIYNSFIYSAPDNHINVSLSENGSFANITISDRGIGMTNQQLENIFSPLTSYDKYGVPQPGLGLGLTLSKMIVNEHGGTIAISSSEGVGTTIAFNIPICQNIHNTVTMNQTTTDYVSDHFSSLYINLVDLD